MDNTLFYNSFCFVRYSFKNYKCNEKQKGILNLDSTSKGVVFQPFDLIKEKEEKKDELSK